MGLYAYSAAGASLISIGAWESLTSASESLNRIPSPSQNAANTDKKTTSSQSTATFVTISILSVLFIINSSISLNDAVRSKDNVGFALQLEVISIALLFLLYSGLGILSNTSRSFTFPPQLLDLIYAFAFGEEFLLFYTQNKDPSGIENRYYDLILVPIAICLFSTVVELKIRISPKSTYPRLARGLGLVFQGMWTLQMGFSFYSKLIANGCSLHERSRGNFTIKCKDHPEYHRRRAIATLQFNVYLAVFISLVVGVYSVFCRKYGIDRDYMRYKPIEDVQMNTDHSPSQFTLDSDDDNGDGVKEARRSVECRMPMVLDLMLEVGSKKIVKWLEDTHNLKLSQSAISKAFKRSINNDDQQALSNPNAKRLKPLKYPLMESALNEWFVWNQEHVNISGELLKEKDRKFLKSLYPEAISFEFSNGWLEKFKHRHAIRSFRRFGESGSVDMEKIEASLFYRMQADNSLATKQLEGRKQNKERITIVICTNGDGSDKVPLWIIGKFLNHRCLKNVNRSTLNCTYRANSNAWMTSLFFVEWLKWFDSRLDRNVLLLLDNCTAHGKKEHLPPLHHTNVMFLPPNSTSKIQPCDAGIIINFKGYYRQKFNRLLLKRIEDRVLEPSKISLLDGINAVAAWSIDVKPRTIDNCFKHCKIRTVEVDELQVAKEMDEENQKLLKELKSQELGKNEENNLEDDSIEVQKVSCEEALSLLDKLEMFWVQQEGWSCGRANAHTQVEG